MRLIKVITIIAVISLSAALALATGDAQEGKKLFNDPTLGGSTNERSCNSCHMGGKGIEQAGTKVYTKFMGQGVSSLEEVINVCITNPLRGKALPSESKQMQDIVAYIRTLGK